MSKKSLNPDSRTRFFGVFSVQTDRERQTMKLQVNYARLAAVLGSAFLALYIMVVAAGFVWLHEVRNVKDVEVLDVALLRVGRVKAKVGQAQFLEAASAWKASKYQAAYIAYLSGVRNAPDFVAGRLEAASFLSAAGVLNLAVITLEEGLRRKPSDQTLLTRTLTMLTGSGRDREALRLLREPQFKTLPADSMALIRMYEVLATLNLEGPVAAKALLDGRPDVRARVLSAPVVARVLWASGEKSEAMGLLGGYLVAMPKDYIGYALLAEYQEAGGQLAEALMTAERACAELPELPAARLLKLAALSRGDAPLPWKAEMETYLTEFRSQPQALALLAELAGKRGWVPLARGLYEAALGLEADARIQAMFYAEALFRNSRAQEAMEVMLLLERQSSDEAGFLVLLRQRQIVVAAAMGKTDEAREFARRLASSLSRDPERLEATRRRFVQVGLVEVAAELVGSAAKPRPAAAVKKT